MTAMKELLWDKTLSVDVAEIDQDHRRLLELFNRLGHASEEGEPQAEIEAIMDELISCTGWHFRHEERLMQKYGYAGLEEHRVEHQSLLAGGQALLQRLRDSAAPLSTQDLEFLEHWLTGHIYGADMSMGAYLAETM
jgi:hemerythrin-like metal-binding protein